MKKLSTLEERVEKIVVKLVNAPLRVITDFRCHFELMESEDSVMEIEERKRILYSTMVEMRK